MNRDDENWFDALAGKPNPDTAPATLQEATALRMALLEKYTSHSSEPQNLVNFSSAQLLRARLRSEGLIPSAQTKSNSKRAIIGSLAATILICAGLSVNLEKHPDFNGSETLQSYRGGEEVAAILVTDPKLMAQQLEQRLSDLNIRSQIQCSSSQCTIEAYVPSAQEDAVNALIKQNQKSVGSNGHLFLQFRRQEK
jgi:hypothetical protein